MAMALSHVSKLEQLSPLVFRVLGCNANAFTLQGTNTYIVGNGPQRVLIDTGDANVSEYIVNLSTALQQINARISLIVCTHYHGDHVGGAKQLLTDSSLAHLFHSTQNTVKIHKMKRPGVSGAADDQSHAPNGYEFVKHNHLFEVPGASLRVVSTPGHTDDHCALWLEQEQSVFSGDCVLGEGTAVFEDLHSYMHSLNTLTQLTPKRIYPGHGPVVDDCMDKLQMYISHRMKRETQILEFLSKSTGQAFEPLQIVDGVYGSLSFPLRMGACGNVSHHLLKLQKDAKVTKTDDGKWKVEKSNL